MASRSSVGGIEVPITGSDSLNWFSVQIPLSPNTNDDDGGYCCAPETADAASCFTILQSYLIWRIRKTQPRTIELLEFNASLEFPKNGVRLNFPEDLSPFAFICQNHTQGNSGYPYLLYVMTVSGVAYVLKMRHISEYATVPVFPQDEFIEYGLQACVESANITAVAATFGSLIIGRDDGSIGCFQLGVLEQNELGFVHELRDDAGIARLWGLMTRGRSVRPVSDLVILEVRERRLLFVLHEDGSLRVWDLQTHTKILTHPITALYSTGATFSRIWVGEANPDSCVLSIATLYSTAEMYTGINICSLKYNVWDKINLVPELRVENIPLEEDGLVDLKITSNKLWILKEDGLVTYDIVQNNVELAIAHNYSLHETFVSDTLFQGSEHSPDDLIWTSLSLFSTVKEQVVPFVSSIFLRRLLQPGVHQNAAISATIQDFNKGWTDFELKSLTSDVLKKEIFSLIENEGGTENPISTMDCWKKFCSRYFHNWCKNNTLFGLLVDSSTGAVGLIRQNSISLFRSLEDIELLIYDSFGEFGDYVISGMELPDNDLDREILFEVLRCVSMIDQQLGKAASAVFYEALVSLPVTTSEDILPRLLKILETGYSSSVAAVHISQLGTDTAWKKKLADHKRQRIFSAHMLLSLNAFCTKTGGWGKVLDVIENYLKFLVPRKSIQKLDSQSCFNINTSIVVQSTAQISKVMFESALDMLLLLGYLVNISGQVHLMHEDISRIQHELIPMIQEILIEWLILHFLGTTSSESPSLEDFSAQLSSLYIDTSSKKKSWTGKLGTCEFTLGSLLFINFQNSSEDLGYLSSKSFPSPNNFTSSVRNFTSWMIWGSTEKESLNFLGRSTELAMILLGHGQYEAVENVFTMIDAHTRKEKTCHSAQGTNGEWCKHLHLLGICLLARAQCGLKGVSKEQKVREAICCFFRASSGFSAPEALQSLSIQGLPALVQSDCASMAVWKLQYYQWAMQIFEQYNMSEGACQFALAALEQVDEVLSLKNDKIGGDPLNEPLVTIRGRLWTNVFNFALDLNQYNDAYCAIISNPDEDSKYLCLRRFIIVLCERAATKTLCDGQLPFVGLIGKVEQELVWKAERSDIGVSPNPYKLLYAFEAHRHNWRKAAAYMYRYSVRLRNEVVLEEKQFLSKALQERLDALSAAINALNLVDPAFAWIDPQLDGFSCPDGQYPSKKVRKVGEENLHFSTDVQFGKQQFSIDIEKLEHEFVLTTAQYSLSLVNISTKLSGNQDSPSDLVNLLVKANLYDIVFTVLLKFWKGSELKREIGRVFIALSHNCCPNEFGSSFIGDDCNHSHLLTASKDEPYIDRNPIFLAKPINPWEALELYLVKYKKLHPRLPVVVAETLLHTDPQIELPLWLVNMFKCGPKATGWGMTGQEADPASLFRLYVNCNRFTEATNMLLEYIHSFATLRSTNLVKSKKMSAVWFPYTSIERLWGKIEELRSSGHMIEQCDKLKKLLQGALSDHLKLITVDSEDALSSATC